MLLRNNSGIIVNDTNIRPHDIIEHLSQLPGKTVEEAQQLLDPSDKQNVPKVVSLIQHLAMLNNALPPQSEALSH